MPPLRFGLSEKDAVCPIPILFRRFFKAAENQYVGRRRRSSYSATYPHLVAPTHRVGSGRPREKGHFVQCPTKGIASAMLRSRKWIMNS